jgi:hypothetical protein
MLIEGKYVFILSTLAFFISLQVLISILGIMLDKEALSLCAYAPLFVIGYKQLIDIFIVKAFFDVVLRRKVKWTRATRIGSQP